MLRLLLIRHADPDYTTDSLTALGRREAAALAERVAEIAPDELLTSPFGRARETAGFSEAALNTTATVVPWAGELVSLIDLPGLGDVGAAWNAEGAVLRAGMPAEPALRVEDTLTETMDLADAYLVTQGLVRSGEGYRVTAGWQPRTVALFCHAGFATAWLAHLLGLPIGSTWAGFYLAPSSVTTILFERRDSAFAVPRALAVGDISHLSGRPGLGQNYQGLQGIDSPSPIALTDSRTSDR